MDVSNCSCDASQVSSGRYLKQIARCCDITTTVRPRDVCDMQILHMLPCSFFPFHEAHELFLATCRGLRR